MTQELPPGLEADEIEELTKVVADSLGKGEDPQKLAQQLIDSGWEPDQANNFVGSVQQYVFEAQNPAPKSESSGWLTWIGVIVGINFLSWLFDWGFWIY